MLQRYESGEHALIGGGSSYPFANAGELTLPNGAHATPGELVAFGDFYSDLEQMARLPRQETEALVGFCRLEALWYQVRRAKRDASGSAPGAGATAPDARRLEVFPTITGDDPIWQTERSAKTYETWRRELYDQFKPAWDFFAINFPVTSAPPGGIVALKATLGRRRFRGAGDDGVTNDTLYGQNQQPGRDPSRMGGDYIDMASQNVSHFTPDNWATWWQEHQRACEDSRAGRTDTALARDALGLHFLTDRFSSGHTINKEDLMSYATNMMISLAHQRDPTDPENIAWAAEHRESDWADDDIRNLLKGALASCFEDEAVQEKWSEGALEAYNQHLIGQGELELLTALPGGQIADQVLDVVMAMPWRNVDGEVQLTPESRNYGPDSAERGQGDYHLGAGNLAAKQVHDALNAIGFTVQRGDGRTWRMQGDDHLTADTLDAAHEVVELSQRQVRAGAPDAAAIRHLLPTTARMDAQAIRDYFQGGTAEHDTGRVDELVSYVEGLEIPLSVENSTGRPGREAMSAPMTEICQRIMQIIFMAPRDASGRTDTSAHGVNIPGLKAFLIDQLPDMVPMAYVSAHAADLPQQALEAYAPYSFEGDTARRLPRAANELQVSGGRATFNLNVTGCEPGDYTIGYRVLDRDSGYDFTESGLRAEKGVSDEHGSMGGAAMNIMGPTDTDDEQAAGTQVVTVPAGAAATGGDRTFVPVTIDDLALDHPEHYILIYAEEGRTMAIGRSNASEDAFGFPNNYNPVYEDPQVTGPDSERTRPLPELKRATQASEFLWSGSTLTFRVEPTDAPLVHVSYYNEDWGSDRDGQGRLLPGARNVDSFVGGGSVNVPSNGLCTVTMTGDADNPGDTYVVVYATPDDHSPIGRSGLQP